MASLREIKDRIGSVRSTLKITSAMKLVSSAKLRKAQAAIETMYPYQRALSDILSRIPASALPVPKAPSVPAEESAFGEAPVQREARVAVVAIASNTSLCGGFNAAAVKAALGELGRYKDPAVFAVGRKMADKLRKAGYPSRGDFNSLSGSPAYDQAEAFARDLIERYEAGEFDRVVLVYNHFVSTASQKVVVEEFLPGGIRPDETGHDDCDYIFEPDVEEIARTILPQVLKLKIYTVLLDSAAAEFAARTVAMQTASDNADQILGELTLEYNKGRQQKITAEILDLLGGAQ